MAIFPIPIFARHCAQCTKPNDSHPERILRYLYDLTTSAHWGGADVGIVRVERQLARRARQHLGDVVEFCIYDRYRNLFLTIEDEIAAEIIEGRTQVKFMPLPSPAAAARQRFNAARRRLRRAILANATVYQVVQRLRGRSFTREDILRIQNDEFSAGSRIRPADAAGSVPVTDIPHRDARLDAETLVISGGLDWDFKDIKALAASKRKHRFQYCTIIHDIIPILFPHLVVPALVPVFADYFAQLTRLADYAMCNSDATRRDWMRYCDERGTTMPSHVFPLGSDLPAIPESTPSDLPEPLHGKQFALFVSTIEPRKNHRMLYEAWDRCVRSKTIDPECDRLVFVGRPGWAINDLMREMSVNPATHDTLVVLNHVPDALLRSLYRHSAFVVFPSLYEGYGLPLAEALAYGKPCVSSNAGSLPEIGGDLVIRIDPKDTIRWADAIAHYMRSAGELHSWGERIRAEFRPVTWDQSAARFFGTVKGFTA